MSVEKMLLIGLALGVLVLIGAFAMGGGDSLESGADRLSDRIGEIEEKTFEFNN